MGTNKAEELESKAQLKADEYIKQFLPHVDTTGHWIGCIDGFKQRQSEIDELTKACEYKDRLYKGLNGMLQEKENEVLELTKEVERLRNAMQLFCDRVDKGEVRSTKTYNQFKELLTTH